MPPSRQSDDVQKRHVVTPATRPAIAPPVAQRKDASTASISPQPFVSLPATKDWNGISLDAARQSIDSYFREQDALAARWQLDRSVMFRPDDGYDEFTAEPATFRDLPFRAPVGVAGIGITIGRCFIGLPLLGVPVEQRSPHGLNLVVCAPESL